MLVQPNRRVQYQLRKVAVARRTTDVVCLRTQLSARKDRGVTALAARRRVVTTAVLELTAAYRGQLETSGK